MKFIFALGFLFIQSGFAKNMEFTNSEKHQFSADQIQSAQIHNSTGNVHIAPVTSKVAYVVINKIKWGPRCSAHVKLDKGLLLVETDDTAWILDHECRVDLILSLPRSVPLQIRAGTGDVKVVGTRADIDVKVGSGLISLKGEMNSLKALSGSGDVRVKGQVGQVDIKTGSGDIEMEYNLAPSQGKLALRTGSGDVQVFLPEKAQVKSQISTGNGTVVNEFSTAENSKHLEVEAASETGNIQIRKK